MMKGLDTNLLRYLCEVAERGSITAAALKLDMSQPALTNAMRRLEERFNTKLLLRGSRGVSLTESGHELVSSGRALLHDLQSIEDRILSLEGGLVGHFTLGCHPSLGAYFLPEFLLRFVADAPRVEVKLTSGRSDDMRTQVVQQEIHFALSVNPRPHPDLVMTRLFRDAVGLFAQTEAGVRNVDEAVHRVRSSALLLMDTVPQSIEFLEKLREIGAEPKRLIQCGSLEMVKSLTMAGVGLGILPHRVAAYHAEDSLISLSPHLPFVPDWISLLYRGDIHRTKAAMALKDALVEHGRALDASIPLCSLHEDAHTAWDV